MIMFKACFLYMPSIQRIDVKKVTNSSVFIGEAMRREARKTSWSGWYESFKEAKKACINAAKAKIDYCQMQLDYYNKALSEAESLTEPLRNNDFTPPNDSHAK